MKIAIQERKGSFSEQWVSYCKSKGIEYKMVNCYAPDIIGQLSDCGALMWHFHHASQKDMMLAKQLLYSVQMMGKRVFPDFNSMWHFDDKLGQKYLLDAIGAPMVPTVIFYSEEEALEWVKDANFPKVFKLSTGAGGQNVRLVKNTFEAEKVIRKAFGKGFKQYNASASLKDRWYKFNEGLVPLKDVMKGFIRLVCEPEYSRLSGRERSYAYFQDYIPENDHDIRVIVVGGKAFAIKRMVRKSDFRASGSGHILYEKKHFNKKTISLAFHLSEKLHSQCMAYDFIHKNDEPLLIEISYGFSFKGYINCPGYWDEHLNWHEGKFNPYGWMVDMIIQNENE